MADTISPAATWRGGEAEAHFLGALNTDVPWALVNEFTEFVREAGTEGEARAVAAITSRLDRWGVQYTVHRPRCYISLPRGATVTATLDDGTTREFKGTTARFRDPDR